MKPPRPKVVHVTEAMGGGVQSAMARLMSLIPEADTVALVRPRSGESSYVMPAGVDVRRFDGPLVPFLLWVRRNISVIRPDVVHFHSSLAGLGRLLVPKGAHVVYSPHCFAFERTDIGRAQRAAYVWAERLLSRQTDAFVAVSPHEGSLCTALGGPAEVHFVPNVVVAPGNTATTQTDRVVMVGRIGHQKLPRLFADIASRVGDRCQFVWIGDGDTDDRKYLRDAGVDVTGWLSKEDVAKQLESATLYLHTAAWESAPMSIAEAASSGVPVICRNLPALDSLGYPLGGIEVGDLAESVVRFLDEPSYREGIKSATRSAALRYTESDARLRLVAAYNITDLDLASHPVDKGPVDEAPPFKDVLR